MKDEVMRQLSKMLKENGIWMEGVCFGFENRQPTDIKGVILEFNNDVIKWKYMGNITENEATKEDFIKVMKEQEMFEMFEMI